MHKFIRLLQISFRNVLRNKRRSILTLLILIFGSTGLILVGGFFDNILDRLRESFIHSQSGHLQMNAQGYYENGASNLFQYLMKDVSEIDKAIKATPHVLFTVPHLQFGGMASSEVTNIAVVALGVDPQLESQMGSQEPSKTDVPSINIVEGKNLDAEDPYGVILGKGLMKALGLKIGDTFNFLTTREGGAIDGAEFHVRGSFETLLKYFDDRSLKLHLTTARRILGLSNELHSLLVILDQTQNTSVVDEQLKGWIKSNHLPLEIITWEQQGQYYGQSRAFLNKIFVTVLVIISIIFWVSIANTINMSLFERMREFGTMMALGNSRSTLCLMIFFESALLGLIGATLGVLIGCVAAQIVSSIGIPMPPPPLGSYGYYGMITLSRPLLAEAFLISLTSALLAAIIPSYRASHFEIIHALGYV